MGLRHLTIVDSDNVVMGIVTRQNITEHHLHEKWHHEGSEMQKHINVEVIPSAYVNVNEGLDDEHGNRFDYFGDDESMYADSSYAGSEYGGEEARKGFQNYLFLKSRLYLPNKILIGFLNLPL